MPWCRKAAVTAAAVALMLAPIRAAQGAEQLRPPTRANLLAAMHAEAFAYAKYTLFAEQAAHSGYPKVAALFTRTAQEELGDHFTQEARLLGFIGNNIENLQVGIAGESQDVTDYGRWAREATAAGCRPAAELLAEVRRDEAGHLARFATSVQALVDPASGAKIPAPPTVDPVAVKPGPPRCTGRTLANLRAAMEGEAFAYAKYTLFADQARATGQPSLAALFAATAQVELREHFVAEANLAGLTRDTKANLRSAIAGETEDISMYGKFAEQAAAAGDPPAARLFREIQRDEQRHQAAFREALKDPMRSPARQTAEAAPAT